MGRANRASISKTSVNSAKAHRPKLFEVVHARGPVDVRGRLLLLGVLFPVALDLDYEVQEIVGTSPVVQEDHEVG